MHYRTLILAFALIACTGFGSLMIGGGVPAAGGGTTSFANFPVDFEANENCGDIGAPISFSNSWSCSASPGLSGSSYRSGNSSDTNGSLIMQSSFSEFGTTGILEVRFVFYMGSDPSGVGEVLFSTDADAEEGFELRVDGDTSAGFWRIISEDGTSDDSAADSLVISTEYRVCIRYDMATDIATLYVDNTSTDYCTTEVAESDGAGSPDGVDGLYFHTDTAGGYFRIDDIDARE